MFFGIDTMTPFFAVQDLLRRFGGKRREGKFETADPRVLEF
jgi:hypothetical protein